MKSKTWVIGLLAVVSFRDVSAQSALEKSEITISGFLDGYYAYNLNSPKQPSGIDAASVSSASIPPANNTYRYYDTYHNQMTLNLAELTVKATLAEVAFLVDFDFGPFADLNATAASESGALIDESSKHIGQAVFSYRPKNSKFSFDAGKMYSHLGVETVKSKDNFNYSRSVTFSYAIPFWHTGARLGYDVLPGKLQTSFFIYNGWNTQYDTNRAKTLGAQVRFTPNGKTSLVYNFLGGPERSDSESDWRMVHEINFVQTFSDSMSFIADLVYASEDGATIDEREKRAEWYGALAALRYQFNDDSYIGPRYEIYRDQDGYNLGGGSQTIHSATLTYGRKISPGFESRFEIRHDSSSRQNFVSDSGTSKSQTTALIAGLISF